MFDGIGAILTSFEAIISILVIATKLFLQSDTETFVIYFLRKSEVPIGKLTS